MSAPAEGVGGVALGASGTFGAVADASSNNIVEPFDTLSPTFTFSCAILPASGEGISIVALSDSSVMSDCSLVTASPGLTSTSMTSTSLKSPMSGTLTWLMRSSGSYGGRVRFVGVDAVLLDGLGNGLRLHLAGIHQGPQRG